MKSVYFLLIVTLFFSCNSETKPIDGYLVEVEAPGVYNGIRSYIQIADERGRRQPIDTAIVMNEKFVFEGKTDNPGLYYLTIDNVAQPLTFILSNEKISVKIDKEKMSNSEINSEHNLEYKKFNDGLETIVSELKKLSNDRRMAFYNKDTVKVKAIEEKLKNGQSKVVDYGFDYINDNPNKLVSLILLEQQTKTRGIDGEKIVNAYNNLSNELKATTKGKRLNTTVNILAQESKKKAQLAIGKVAPNFEAPTPNGDMVSLNDLKGKVTIIDFWASWCGPCRRENPNVVRTYEKYHDKGLEIIGVSLDKKGQKDRWLKAIEDDKLTWHHVSNLNYFNGPVAQQYNIKAIPATFILDKDGKIVDKNLRGQRLEDRIKELLQ